MICYKDKTFCSSDCVETRCHRNFTESERQGSRAWGATFGHENDAPVAFSDFSVDCSDYLKPKGPENESVD